jgi:hypothetical protein
MIAVLGLLLEICMRRLSHTFTSRPTLRQVGARG